MEEEHGPDGIAGKAGQLGRNIAAEKPWKREKKHKQAESTADEIQIFEGKPVVVSRALLASTPPDSGYLRIISENDEQFVIPSKVVECFQCVGVILHSDAIFLEKVENIIRFPQIRPEVLESVLRFVFMEHLNREKANMYWGINSPRLVFQFEVDPGLVMEILHAAHFLGISSLLKVAATMVAHCFEDVPDVSSLPSDLAWCVAEEFSAQGLFDAEERADFKSLDLDTERLWKIHCMRVLPDHPIAPVSPCVSYPSYKEWSVFEGPPPTSWKSLYVSHVLQQLADKQDGGHNDAFFKELSCRGKFVFIHTMRPMFWDWVMCAPGAWPLSLYVAQFPHLFSLSLAKLPLHKILTDGAAPSLTVGDILHNLPYLQHLDISDTGFTAEAATGLSKSLQLHKGLQVLRLAYNQIKTTGFLAIVRTLTHVRTLKLLDVRENGISPVFNHFSLTAIDASALEELFLTGNSKGQGDENYEPSQIRGWSAQTDTALGWSISSDEGRWRDEKSCASNEDASSSECLDMQNYCKQAAPMLSEMPSSLKNLQLAQCNLVDSHIQTLVNCLGSHSVIQILDLADNLISSLGAIVIFSWLKTNKSVRELSLANNRITASSSSALADTLLEHPCIVKISLMANYSFGEENLTEVIVSSVAHGNRMKEQFLLDVRNTDISHTTRGRLLRQLPQLGDYLQLLI